MAFGKTKKKQQNWALKRLKIYTLYKEIDEDKIYYIKDQEIKGIDLKKDFKVKYKWLK